jgi:WD40 repeat protein
MWDAISIVVALTLSGSIDIVETRLDPVAQAKLGLSFDYQAKQIAVSPNGRYRASCDSNFVTSPNGQGYRNGRVTIVETASGKEITTSKWQDGAFFTVAFSPDSRLLAVGGGNVFLGEPAWGDIRVWDTEAGKLQFHIKQAHERVIESLAFSPDQKYLVSGGQDGTVKWWDLGTHKEVRRLDVCRNDDPRRPGRIFHLGFTRDGRVLAIGAGSWNIRGRWGEVWLWDPRVEKRIAVLQKGHEQPVTSLEIVPDGTASVLVVATAARLVKSWRISTSD